MDSINPTLKTYLSCKTTPSWQRQATRDDSVDDTLVAVETAATGHRVRALTGHRPRTASKSLTVPLRPYFGLLERHDEEGGYERRSRRCRAGRCHHHGPGGARAGDRSVREKLTWNSISTGPAQKRGGTLPRERGSRGPPHHPRCRTPRASGRGRPRASCAAAQPRPCCPARSKRRQLAHIERPWPQ